MSFPPIKVLKLEGTEYKVIPFKEFCQLTLREILSIHSEYVLRIGKGLFATGDETLKAAIKREPENAFPFHEVINCALPNFSKEFMDMRLIDLPLKYHSEENPDQRQMIIAQVKEIFPGARVLSEEEVQKMNAKGYFNPSEWAENQTREPGEEG